MIELGVQKFTQSNVTCVWRNLSLSLPVLYPFIWRDPSRPFTNPWSTILLMPEQITLTCEWTGAKMPSGVFIKITWIPWQEMRLWVRMLWRAEWRALWVGVRFPRHHFQPIRLTRPFNRPPLLAHVSSLLILSTWVIPVVTAVVKLPPRRTLLVDERTTKDDHHSTAGLQFLVFNESPELVLPQQPKLPAREPGLSHKIT